MVGLRHVLIAGNRQVTINFDVLELNHSVAVNYPCQR